MGYVTTILRMRDADRETEIACEALDGDGEDGAVIELAVTLGYGSSVANRHEGYVRLTQQHFDALAEWVGHHAEALRSAQWAEENAPKEETDDEWLRASALLAPLRTGGSLDVVEAVAFLRSIVGGDDEE
jgi:hypothetical protein